MTCSRFAAILSIAALSSTFSHAATVVAVPASDSHTTDVSGTASSSSLPDSPGAGLASDLSLSGRVRVLGPKTGLRLHTDAFSTFAIGITSGSGGLGVQVATPLATKVILRLSASFLNYNPVVTEQGIPIDGAIRFRNVGAGVDIYPYRNSFHITPGVTLYNGNKATAVTNIVPGSTFTVNDTAYVSDVTDPVHGTFDINFGRKFAPSLTVGFGNMLRRDSHWSVPIDVGFQYIGRPTFVLKMTGTVCDVEDGCTPIAEDKGTQKDLTQEQTDINNTIAPLRFFPIVKIGLSYRFGHNVNMSLWR